MLTKAQTYLRLGAQSAWVFFPALETVALLRLGQPRPEMHRGGVVAGPATGAGLNLNVAFA